MLGRGVTEETVLKFMYSYAYKRSTNQNFRIKADDTKVYKSHSDPVWQENLTILLDRSSENAWLEINGMVIISYD